MPKDTETKKGTDYAAVGRRKTAVARARLYLATAEVIVGGQKLVKGDIYVNGKPIDQYFNNEFAKALYTELYHTTNTVDRFITTIVVSGSGSSGQLGATTLAIARALCLVDPKFRAVLRKKGYMTRDPRAKERKKPGLPGARKHKSSPKR
jgi:small subunit ribosomal protein S9